MTDEALDQIKEHIAEHVAEHRIIAEIHERGAAAARAAEAEIKAQIGKIDTKLALLEDGQARLSAGQLGLQADHITLKSTLTVISTKLDMADSPIKNATRLAILEEGHKSTRLMLTALAAGLGIVIASVITLIAGIIQALKP